MRYIDALIDHQKPEENRVIEGLGRSQGGFTRSRRIAVCFRRFRQVSTGLIGSWRTAAGLCGSLGVQTDLDASRVVSVNLGRSWWVLPGLCGLQQALVDISGSHHFLASLCWSRQVWGFMRVSFGICGSQRVSSGLGESHLVLMGLCESWLCSLCISSSLQVMAGLVSTYSTTSMLEYLAHLPVPAHPAHLPVQSCSLGSSFIHSWQFDLIWYVAFLVFFLTLQPNFQIDFEPVIVLGSDYTRTFSVGLKFQVTKRKLQKAIINSLERVGTG